MAITLVSALFEVMFSKTRVFGFRYFLVMFIEVVFNWNSFGKWECNCPWEVILIRTEGVREPDRRGFCNYSIIWRHFVT